MKPEKAKTIEKLRDLLGRDVLLLSWPKGLKGGRTRWKHLTSSAMDDPVHFAKLEWARNIGVALGAVSGGLCTINIDDDDWVELILAANPVLKDTLQTKGERGCNLWLRVVGKCPRSCKLTAGGQTIGEFRAGGCQTIIQGVHPSGVDYQIVHESKPVQVAMTDLNIPSLSCIGNNWTCGNTQTKERTERTEGTEKTEGTEATEMTEEKIENLREYKEYLVCLIPKS